MTWLFALWGKTKFYVLAIGAALAAAFAAYWRIREDGKNAARLEQAQAQARSVQQRKEIDDEIDQLGPADVDQRFNQWMRDDDASR